MLTLKSVVIALFLTLFSYKTVASNHQNLQIISATDNGVTLEFTLPPFEVKTHSDCHTIQIPNWVTTNSPPLPLTGVLIQIPATGEFQTQILESHSEILTQINLCDAGLVKDTFPAQLLQLAPRLIWRQTPMTRLRVAPFQWHPQTQELHYFTKIRLQINFEHSLPVNQIRTKSPNHLYHNLQENTLINYREIINNRRTRAAPNDNQLQPAVRMEIPTAGIYRVTYADLFAIGVPVQSIPPSQLQLINQGQAVAMSVSSQHSSQLQPGDYLEFYAQAVNNTFTQTNVYWLYWHPGKRMVPINGVVTGTATPVPAFYEQLHVEQNNEAWLKTPNAPEQDYWFWERLNSSDVKSYIFNMSSLLTQSPATIRVQFQGRSTASPHPNHHTQIKLNGTVIGEQWWDNTENHTQIIPISSELLHEGSNLLTVKMLNGRKINIIYLNWIEVDYWRQLEAVNDTLIIHGKGNGIYHLSVNQFTQPEIMIYDITNPYEVSEIVNFTVTGSNGNYQVDFEVQAFGEKRYYLTTTNQIKSPTNITLFQPHLNTSTNGADYLLITAQEFLPAVQPLIELRQHQGLRAKAVSIEDIYNEFNQGLLDPIAIKKFLRYAYQHWISPAPTYIFMVGDSHYYYLKTGDKANKIPLHLSADISEQILIADDNWFVSVDGEDFFPDMLIGRAPGKTYTQVTELVNKIIRFETSSRVNPKKALLVADDEVGFENLSEKLLAFLPSNFSADKVYLRNSYETATQDIVTSINNGVMVTNYVGHGSMYKWGLTQTLLTATKVQSLTNLDQLTFAIMLTCVNGYFAGPYIYSLAEEFMLSQGGAIGVFASSSLSYLWENTLLAQQIFVKLFQHNNRILGVLTTEAKIAAYQMGADQHVMSMYLLFGDPAVELPF
jgi:hypothetical protein